MSLKSAGEGTRTHTLVTPEPKSGASANFATPAQITRVVGTQSATTNASYYNVKTGICQYRIFGVFFKMRTEMLEKEQG